MPNPVIVTVGPLAAGVADNIAQSQALAAAGNLTLNGALVSGGVATMDVQRRVIITSGGNDTGITFTIYGTNNDGNAFQEIVTGASGAAAQSTCDFKTVTRVAASGAVATTVEVGTNGVASSKWFPVDFGRNPINVGMRFNLTGAANFDLELTMDDPQDVLNVGPVGTMPAQYLTNTNFNNPPVPFSDATVTGKSASLSYTLTMPVYAYRLKINSGATGTDHVQLEAIQAGYLGA